MKPNPTEVTRPPTDFFIALLAGLFTVLGFWAHGMFVLGLFIPSFESIVYGFAMFCLVFMLNKLSNTVPPFALLVLTLVTIFGGMFFIHGM